GGVSDSASDLPRRAGVGSPSRAAYEDVRRHVRRSDTGRGIVTLAPVPVGLSDSTSDVPGWSPGEHCPGVREGAPPRGGVRPAQRRNGPRRSLDVRRSGAGAGEEFHGPSPSGGWRWRPDGRWAQNGAAAGERIRQTPGTVAKYRT